MSYYFYYYYYYYCDIIKHKVMHHVSGGTVSSKQKQSCVTKYCVMMVVIGIRVTGHHLYIYDEKK